MYRRNVNRPGSRWFAIPLVILVALMAIGIVSVLYFQSASPTTSWPWYPFPFLPFFFFIPIVFLIFFGLRWFFWGGWGCGWYGGPYAYNSAFDTLRQRYARGEITREQYDEMAKKLGESE